MLSLFIRRPKPTPPTFNERVAAFWKWYEEVATRFYQTIEDKKCSDLTDETSAKIDELFPGFAWVFGPGEKGIGHSFTLSGEGNMHRQLLALHWLSQAPKIEGWTFYAARQPGPIKGHTLEMAGKRFNPAEIWVTPAIDTERSVVDLNVWHPSWETLDQRQRNTITFLFLDESLGEYGTDQWIGEIKFSKDKLAQSFPLEELADFIARTAAKNDWKKYPPGESYTGFKVTIENQTYPRSDTAYQTTAVPSLFREYWDSNGEMSDPLKGFGADYIYIVVTRDYFPEGNEVAKRGEIEDSIDAALKAALAGRCIGGSFGAKFGYMDFLIYDGPRSIDIIKRKLKEIGVLSGTMIEYFAREKRGQRIAL